jgi:hypothetical protein
MLKQRGYTFMTIVENMLLSHEYFVTIIFATATPDMSPVIPLKKLIFKHWFVIIYLHAIVTRYIIILTENNNHVGFK